jgi:hypothetical protein
MRENIHIWKKEVKDHSMSIGFSLNVSLKGQDARTVKFKEDRVWL